MKSKIRSGDLLRAARAADLAANARTDEEERRAIVELARHQEAIQIGLINARMRRLSQTPHPRERLPVREGGDDIGRIEASIPRDLFFHLMQQKNFGWEGMTSDEGMNDLLETHPACRVKTVSGKTTIGYTGTNRRRKPLVNFGPGTLVL